MKVVIKQLKGLESAVATENNIIEIMSQAGRAGGIVTTYHPAYGADGVPNFLTVNINLIK